MRELAGRHQGDLVLAPAPMRNLDRALAALDHEFVQRPLIPPHAALDDERLAAWRENGGFLFQGLNLLYSLDRFGEQYRGQETRAFAVSTSQKGFFAGQRKLAASA